MDRRGASEFVVADRGNFHRGRACRSLNSATRDGAVRHFPMSTIPRLLILGGGAVVRLLHAPALARLGWCGRAKVLEVSEKARENLRTEFPDLATEAGDFREVLADPRVRGTFDGVVVALPNRLHEEAVKLAVKAGLPVLCEKPLAMGRESGLQLAALAAECRCPLSVAMVRRLV